ncbi:MAG: HAMP domain-containing histidine kinase [Ktedonobacteraceae bacterium]|nr:HAMP domain-containing histidine kinase [Ktedonobacteraceae bacterium]
MIYITLPARLAFFSTLLVGLACLFFGTNIYNQAETAARNNLDDLLRNRAGAVQLGKDMLGLDPQHPPSQITTLPSVDSLGTNGVAIKVYAVTDEQPQEIASTSPPTASNDFMHTKVINLGNSPAYWDYQAIQRVLQQSYRYRNGLFSTIAYAGQQVRVFTIRNPDSLHIIQTARSTSDIEQSINDLRSLFIGGSSFVLLTTLLGTWLISWGILASVRRITRAAQAISASHDFSKRVPYRLRLGRDELATLTQTFNQMLSSLEEAYQRQQRFVANASHELRAPITSIRCNLDLLAKAPDLPAEEVQSALDDTRAEAARMGRLVNDLLQLARLDSATETTTNATTTSADDESGYRKIDTIREEIDLDSLLLEVFRQYRPREDGESYRGPRLLLQHIAPARVNGNADQLKQALVTLVDNALKYTPSEGVVSLALNTAGGSARVAVNDTGIGILPKDLPHIFERFYRADRARTRDRGGSGLGLAIAQSIIQEHRGTIEVTSTPGQGSTFTLLLPLVK